MALHFELKVNGQEIGDLFIQRQAGGDPTPNTRCTYDWEISTGRSSTKNNKPLGHRYGDGPWRLVLKVLEQARDDGALGAPQRGRQYEDVKVRTPAPQPARRTDMHTFFGLSYANYLVLHRSMLQSMPALWQMDFVEKVQELEKAFRRLRHDYGFRVSIVDLETGRFTKDPIPHYNRGRTHLPPDFRE